MQTKKCSRCLTERPLDRFYVYHGKCAHRPGKLHAACKDCEFSDRYARRRADPETTSIVARKAKLKRMFGITPADYIRMFSQQRGRCAICRKHPPDGQRLHIDHCHSSGVVRGLLCKDCNWGLGWFRDSTKLLNKATDYLKLHTPMARRIRAKA